MLAPKGRKPEVLGSTDVTRCAGETQHNLMLVEWEVWGQGAESKDTSAVRGKGNHVGRTLHLETRLV